jgi:hypothetical protein
MFPRQLPLTIIANIAETGEQPRFKWRAGQSSSTGNPQKTSCPSKPRVCACVSERRTGFRVVLPGAGGIIAIAFLPKCPLCWMALIAAGFAGHLRVHVFIALVSLAALITCYIKSSRQIRTATAPTTLESPPTADS